MTNLLIPSFLNSTQRFIGIVTKVCKKLKECIQGVYKRKPPGFLKVLSNLIAEEAVGGLANITKSANANKYKLFHTI